MARIEPGDIRVSLGASIGAAAGSFSGGSRAFERGLNQLERGVDQFSRIASSFAVSLAERENERNFQTAELAYKSFKSNLLYGQDGIMFRKGEEAKGSTQQISEDLQAEVGAQMATIENPVVRKLFKDFSDGDLLETIELSARNESRILERTRQLNAGVLHTDEMRQLALSNPTKLLPGELGGNDVRLDELFRITEERISTWQPELNEESVRATAREALANAAEQAVFVLMASGSDGERTARNLQEFWEPFWNGTMRGAVNNRIIDGVGYSAMDFLAAKAATELGPAVTKKALRKKSIELYKEFFRAKFGGEPPDKHVQEMGRRAVAFDVLSDDAIAQKQEARRGGQIVGLIKAIQRGDRKEIEGDLSKLIESANGANDLEFLEKVLAIKKNYDTTGSIWPARPTQKGLEMIVDGSGGLERSAKLAAAAEMPKTEWGDFITPEKGSSATELDIAIDDARNIATGQGGYDKVSTNAEFASKRVALTRLDRLFIEEEKRKPSKEELKDLALSIEVNLTDRQYWPESGFSGDLSDFLRNPLSADKLNVDDPKDAAIIDLAIRAAVADGTAATVVIRGLGIKNLRPEGLEPRHLADNPALAARLIEFGIITNKSFAIQGGLPSGFRDRAIDAVLRRGQ